MLVRALWASRRERERERNLVLEVCDLRGKTQRAFGTPDVNSEFLQDADRLPI